MTTTIKIKNSAVAGKVPQSSDLVVAELALNLVDRKLYTKDVAGDIFEIGGGANVPGGPTPPSSGNDPGDLFFDTTTNTLLYWNGTDWTPIAGDEAIDLEDLADVEVTNIDTGDILSWNGSSWVNRAESDLPYVPAGDDGNWDALPEVTELGPDDLMVINTGGISSRITGTDLAESLGSGGALIPIDPTADKISATPAFEGGTGTIGDPFILSEGNTFPAGGSTNSAQVITIDMGAGAEGQVRWIDNSPAASGSRFRQNPTTLDNNGTWVGRLAYNDNPDSTAETLYTGDLQIGEVYVRWIVNQEITSNIKPTPDEITSSPGFQGGDGSQGDPYLLETQVCAPAGSVTASLEQITIAIPGGVGGRPVEWIDNSSGADTRFQQPTGVTSSNGTWTGRLQYADIPNSLTDEDYIGDLQIGTTYFRWIVQQRLLAVIDPTPDQITGSPDFISGDGSEGDPYQLADVFCAPAGGSAQSKEVITITVPGFPNTAVIFTDNNAATNGSRFNQQAALTNSSGVWNGRFQYLDIPDTATDTDYTAKINIGETYFSWTVRQFIEANIQPTPGDITSNPGFESGTGTPGDPFILRTIEVRPAGSTGQTEETITITAPAGLQGLPVVWTVTGGTRFDQPEGITGPGGVWTGRFVYADNPSSVVDNTYTANIQIGTAYFRWSVKQFLLSSVSPQLTNVSLIEANPDEDPRFTSQEFVASTSLAQDGVPNSDKTFTAYVEGAITLTPTSSEIVNVTGDKLTFTNNQDLTVFEVGDEVTTLEYSQFIEPLESSVTVSGPARVWSDDLTSANGFSYPTTYAFNGDPTNFASANPGPYSLFWDTRAYPLTGRLVVRAACAAINVYDADDNYTQVATGEVYVSEVDCGEVSDVHRIEFRVTSTQQAGLQNVTLNGEEIIDNQGFGTSTALTFANGTDMSALEAGDAVSQAGGISARTWSNDFSSTTGFAVNSGADRAFDGSLSSYAQGGNLSGTMTWDTSAYPITGQLTVYSATATNGAVSEVTVTHAGGTTTVNGGGSNAAWPFVFTNLVDITRVDITRDINQGILVYGFELDGVILTDGKGIGTTTGTVGSITDTTATLSSSTGTWVDGQDVTGPLAKGEGEIASINAGEPSMTLTDSNGKFQVTNTVVGPRKSTSSAVRYLDFQADGTVTDLLPSPMNPLYTTNSLNPGITLKFPALFPSGETPDDELGTGTKLVLEVTATNTAGSSGPLSAEVQPEGPAAPTGPLAGLTTLYTGNSTSQSIVNGIDLVNNDGLVWVKNRDNGINHALFDTLRGNNTFLQSDNISADKNQPESLSFTSNGFQLGSSFYTNNLNEDFVAWTFGKAEGYFDVVQWTGNGQNPGQTINHSLGTKPGLIITKPVDIDGAWFTYSSAVPDPNASYLRLDEANKVENAVAGNLWDVTDTSFVASTSLNLNSDNGPSGTKYVAYLFAEDTPGVIKCGSYTGGSDVKIVTGFRPQWLLFKRTDNANGGDWMMYDAKRPADNPIAGNIGQRLYANDSGAETSYGYFKFVDDGFEQYAVGTGNEGIYVAIAEPPATRSQTDEEFIAQDIKFESYEYRKAVYLANMNVQKAKLIASLEAKGYTNEEIFEIVEP